MQLTRAADYAVRVIVHLATLPAGYRATRGDLAAAGQVPEHFLSKILQALTRGGLVVSHRGVQGGFTLARAPESVTLLEVVELIDGPIQLNVCLTKEEGCVRQRQCAVHRVWAEAQRALVAVLGAATFDRLAKESSEEAAFCGGTQWI